ncbi:hypothetical protein A1O3_08600 [Capronia epimyces CBS 606.96]|uniref:NmrA-like domain-containing protein n=1 Tax=Capronia epimyces CBS 606.96 TaxID=1182542 RepID=W9Y9N0_9EURO|nr:uncharacterized protein A1O3_08600 [Capronia epimyces CBS 606.96]EXJ79099.1 hypothetical protein A1O3_08600 [Capronia epimyces CBS 606.96]
MVSLQTVRQSNARLASLPPGLVAVFIGATSGIGLNALQQFAQQAQGSSPRIYSVSRPATAAAHQSVLASLGQSHPTGTYKLITADVSLVCEIDKVVDAVASQETKVDILFMSAGFMAFEGRKDTREGLDPSMSTRYYSRLRAVQRFLPLLNNPAVSSPRVVSVLAGGLERPLNESDLDLRDPSHYSVWNASFHCGTMGTLALERIARQNPRLSIVHWYPGPVATPGLARAAEFGMSPPDQMALDEAGARAVFLATNDRYAVQVDTQEGGGGGGPPGLVPVPDGLEVAKTSAGGIFLIDPLGEPTDNERVLADLRERGVDEAVWNFTQDVFAACQSAAPPVS